MEERKKICVVSMENHTGSEVYRIAHANHEAYCQRNGYAYFEVNDFSRYPHRDHPHWCKYLVIQEAMQTHDADYYLWIDMDAFFTGMDVRLESFIPSEDAQVCMSKDCAGGRGMYDFGYCNGVILLKNTPLVKKYIGELCSDWLYDLGRALWEKKIIRFRDQEMMQFLEKTGEFRGIITEIPPKGFQSFINGKRDNVWEQGDCILHLAGLKTERREAILNGMGYSLGTGEVGAGMDIVIPLGNGSKSHDDELRILLRSIERHARGLHRIVLATQNPPGWLRGVHIVQASDLYTSNKDANIIGKVLVALRSAEIHGEFVLCADDNVFNMDVDLASIPMLYNRRGLEEFREQCDTKWRKRMLATMEFVASRGMRSDRNYDIHAPQRFNAWKVANGMNGIDYRSGIGYGIYTLFRCVSREDGGEDCTLYKTSHEKEETASSPMDRMFVGYSDDAFLHGLRERLFKMFPDKSRYEA